MNKNESLMKTVISESLFSDLENPSILVITVGNTSRVEAWE